MVVALAACGTRTSVSVAPVSGAGTASVLGLAQNAPDRVIVTSDDLTNRPYRSLGDISVSAAKWTIFDKDPTRAMIDKALQEKAAAMGADAVVLARYGTVGIGLASWGELEGKGRAVQFTVMNQ